MIDVWRDGEHVCSVPSPEEIEFAKTPGGGWTRDQLAVWGVDWPPPRGWKRWLEDEHATLVSLFEAQK